MPRTKGTQPAKQELKDPVFCRSTQGIQQEGAIVLEHLLVRQTTKLVQRLVLFQLLGQFPGQSLLVQLPPLANQLLQSLMQVSLEYGKERRHSALIAQRDGQGVVHVALHVACGQHGQESGCGACTVCKQAPQAIARANGLQVSHRIVLELQVQEQAHSLRQGHQLLATAHLLRDAGDLLLQVVPQDLRVESRHQVPPNLRALVQHLHQRLAPILAAGILGIEAVRLGQRVGLETVEHAFASPGDARDHFPQ
mmetsp:Transcript_39350/g.93995  ORF Transcript_39350/g.93995 Transcript_39350/m.93995 type:complete len:252 (+) Transcript_39350:3243-3998(+)